MNKIRIVCGGIAVLSILSLASGCSWIAPRATAAREQARIADALEKQAASLERIAVVLEKKRHALIITTGTHNATNIVGNLHEVRIE